MEIHFLTNAKLALQVVKHVMKKVDQTVFLVLKILFYLQVLEKQEFAKVLTNSNKFNFYYLKMFHKWKMIIHQMRK